jgi:stearoyl-CoA desaturase (delta-9 desaturase)
MLYSGLLDLSLWGYVVAALILTHITIAAVTIFLHRHQAHRGLELHPSVSHFFRLWLWLTTGMATKEWVAVHRKHHAKCETPEDPHSPQVLGIHKVLWLGAWLYAKEAAKPETLERYGHFTPDDWLERNVYSKRTLTGIGIMAAIDILLFGVIPGFLIFGVQMAWIPFWAAGVINGIGHYIGYRHFSTEDASRNLVPWGILIGGEELHNNHHAYGSSAKLSNRWYEFDIGWLYIRILETLGLATVRKVAPKLVLNPNKRHIDIATLNSIITHRYDVVANYVRALGGACSDEIASLRSRVAHHELIDAGLFGKLLHRGDMPEAHDASRLHTTLTKSAMLETVFRMRAELSMIWQRSTETTDQLVKRLQDWCHRAEASGIAPLQEFSRRLRCYA